MVLSFFHKKEILTERLLRVLGEAYSASKIAGAFKLLILDNDSLRLVNGERVSYLPFNRTRDRPNRSELKPIISFEDSFIYSPASLGLLGERWAHGIAQQFLPCKTGFERTYAAIQQWKSRYEKLLESDAKNAFIEQGFKHELIFKGLQLSKKGKHPDYLGDYDVMAFDPENNSLWIVECKAFEKVESPYDYMQLQKRWFGKKGLLEKFERRINYAKSNVMQILSDLGIETVSAVSIRAVLVSNKIFENMIGNSNFEIFSISELPTLLNDSNES